MFGAWRQTLSKTFFLDAIVESERLELRDNDPESWDLESDFGKIYGSEGQRCSIAEKNRCPFYVSGKLWK
jgi:hypothetical protein